MNTILKYILSACFFCIGLNVAKAQIPREPTIAKSPNAASLGEYGNVPVSLYTGLPSISIPLYKVQDGNLSLPIALNYHASGVRPDVHPGWVGMGWSLDAGGVISRNVNDLPDERDQPLATCKKCGIYYAPGYLNNANWDQATFIRSVATGKWTNYTPSLTNNSHQDSEPDEFSFNIAGYSGRFYLDIDGNFKAQCDKPVKIELNATVPFLAVPFSAPTNSSAEYYGGYYPSFSGFSITVEDGTKYVFGGTTNAIEYSIGFFTQDRDYWIASSWYLTKVVTPEGSTLNLSYNREQNKFTNTMYCSGYNLMDMKIENTATGFLESTNPCSSWNSGNIDIYRSFSGKLIAPVYLTEINSSNTKVRFERSQTNELRYPSYAYDYKRQIYSSTPAGNSPAPVAFLPFLSLPIGRPQLVYPSYFDNLQWQKLDRIKIYNSQNEYITGYNMGYSDNPSNSNRTNERLTLLNVTEVGKNGITKPPYSFTYENYQALPGYLSMQTDHWGFFNYSNRYRFFSANPQSVLADVNTEYADREPSTDPSVYLRGMLTTLTYPTKGVTKFEYSQNTYSKQLAELRSSLDNSMSPANYSAGGVRVRRITSWSLDNPSQKTQKSYYYVNSNSLADTASALSSGVLGGKARYYFSNYRIPAYNALNRVYIQTVFSIQSVLPACTNSNGSHLGYSQVIEKNADNSYTISHFTNFDNGRFDDVANNNNILQTSRIRYEPYSSNQESRGKLYKEYLYSSTNQIVKTRDIDYAKIATGFVRSIKASAYSVCVQNADIRVAEGVAYRFHLYSYFPSQERETVYDKNGANGISSSKDYAYHPAIRLLRLVTSLDSKGNTIATRYQYPVDFFYTGSGSIAPNSELQALATMSTRNNIAVPVETVNFKNNQVVGAKIIHFQSLGNNILPSSTEELEVAQPIALGVSNSYVDAKVNQSTGSLLFDNRLVTKITFTDYDTRGNVVGLRKEGNTLTSYMWGYNSTLPIAQVANAAPTEIFHSNFEEDKMVTTTAADVAGTWYSPGYLKFEATPSDPNRPSTRKVAHTGRLAGAMYTGYNGEQAHAFSSTLTIPAGSSSRRYILSGWVYTNGPAASIWLFPNLPGARTSNGTVNYYDGAGNSSRPDLFPSYATTQETGRWVYLQKEVEVPSDATLLTVRLTNFWNGAGDQAASTNGGGVWFDDVRLHPAEAQMVTYTHDPLIGPTSISDPNNQPTYYEYDGLQRLQLVKDREGNVLKHLEYHYQQ
jgi:YD repeat-containing protein